MSRALVVLAVVFGSGLLGLKGDGAQAQHVAGTGTGVGAVACANALGEPHAVVRTLDAVTVVLDDGREVRLAGIIVPPRPVGEPPRPIGDPPQQAGVPPQQVGVAVPALAWPPEHAAASSLAALTRSATVLINVSGHGKDRHGRSMAQLFVNQGGARIWVQRALVEAGHALVTSRFGGGPCTALLLEAERDARDAARGLWASAINRVLDASKPGALHRRLQSFSLVEGKVLNVALRGKQLFLNFGDDWRTDFTVVVATAMLKAAPTQAANFQTLAGHTIRVRGWIERRYGPSIEIFSLDDVEVLSGDPAALSDTSAKP